MNTFKRLWEKLVAGGKRYREQFVAAQAKRTIPFQIRALMKKQKLSQQQLAERSGLSQGVISRAANPAYGNLSLNTLIRIAAGFDVAFVGRFVPFSELGRWLDNLNDESFAVDSFEEEGKRVTSWFERSDTANSVNAKLVDIPLHQAKIKMNKESSRRDQMDRPGDSASPEPYAGLGA